MSYVLRTLLLLCLFSACIGGSDDANLTDASNSEPQVDAGSNPTGCDAIDCGPGSTCDDSLGQPFCSCATGSCNGGAQCVMEAGVSVCGCTDNSLYLGGTCSQPGSCPAGMSWINPTTCIDDLEFSINDFLVFLNGLGSACDDPGPTCTGCGGQRCFPSEAVNPWHYDTSDPGWWVEGDVALGLSYPARYMSFDAAKSACQSVGKHLCSANEWQSSCGGLADQNYPYGSSYQPGICQEGGGFGARPADRGDRSDCVNSEHPSLFDQSGNVWEWTNDCAGNTCQVRGGSYAVDGSFFPDAMGCHFEQGHERNSAEFDIGFRCCASPI